MSIRKNLQIFLCLLGGHATGVILLSYGVLQVYMFSYMHQYDPTISLKRLHTLLPIALIAGTTFGWLQGFLTGWLSEKCLYLVNVVVMCCCCLVMFWFSYSFTTVTVSMVPIGLSFVMLHIYFLSTIVNRVKR